MTVGRELRIQATDGAGDPNYRDVPTGSGYEVRRRGMKIAVVGATGATGRRVVKHALAQGHFVTAVARHPELLSSADRLSFVRGDVLSPGGLTGVLDGVEAVISCIGPEKNLSPGTLMSVGVASILIECKRAKRPPIRNAKWYRLERWTRALLTQPLCRPRIGPDIHCCSYRQGARRADDAENRHRVGHRSPGRIVE
jgi:NAD(P)-dependent dehydrogenase (short-subunit alcohol dehydrogenase family)